MAKGAANGPRSRLSIQTPLGIGDDDVFVFTPALQYDYRVNERFSLQGKLTANIASGNLGNASGPGDVFLTAIYNFSPKAQWQWQAIAGLKIPLSDAGLEADGLPLPMQYQSSLGTFDLITGVSASTSKWQFAFAWQQPLTETNQNAFLPGEWPGNAANAYPPSNKMNRKADLLLRGARQLQLGKAWSASIGLLGIYHVAEDEYLTGGGGNFAPIAGSRGLTLNVTTGFWWQAGSKVLVGITGGAPLVVRDLRPDGLTRQFVIGPEISFNW